MVVLKFCSGNCEVLTLLIGHDQAIPHAARWVMRKIRNNICCSETAYTVDNVLDLDRKSFTLDEKSTYQLLLDAHMYHYSLIRFYLDDNMIAIPKTYIFNEEDEDYALEKDHHQEPLTEEVCEDSKESTPDLELREFLRFLENRQTLVMKAALKARDQQQRLLASCEAFGNLSQRNDLEAAFLPDMPAPDSQEEFFDPICCTSEATRVDHFVDALFDFSKKEENEIYTKSPLDKKHNASFSFSTPKFSDNFVNYDVDRKAEANFAETIAEWEGMRRNVQPFQKQISEIQEAKKKAKKTNMFDSDVMYALDCFNSWPDRSKHYESAIKNKSMKYPDINITMESSQAEGSLSMTVATSTDVEGKIDMVPAYTQTELQMLKEFEQLKISGQNSETMINLEKASVSGDSSTKMMEDYAECSVFCLKTCLEKVEEALQDITSKSVTTSSQSDAIEKSSRKGASKLIREAARSLDLDNKRTKREKEEKKERKERKEKERKEKKEKKEKKERKDKKKRERKFTECKITRIISGDEPKNIVSLTSHVNCDETNKAVVERAPCEVYEDYKNSKYHKFFPEQPICPKVGEMLVLHSLDELPLEKMEELNLVRIDGQNFKRVKTRRLNNLRPVYRDEEMNSMVAPEPCLVFTEESDFIRDENTVLKYFRLKNIGKVNIRFAQIMIRYMSNLEIIDMIALPTLIEIENEYDIMIMVKPTDPRKEAVLIIQVVAETVLSLPTALIVPMLEAFNTEGNQLEGTSQMIDDGSWYPSKCLVSKKPKNAITIAGDVTGECTLARRLRLLHEMQSSGQTRALLGTISNNECSLPKYLEGEEENNSTASEELLSNCDSETITEKLGEDAPLLSDNLELPSNDDFAEAESDFSDVEAIVSSIGSDDSDSSDEYELVGEGDELASYEYVDDNE
ncbi:unnamed protein product [Auanema sp. JU1783]|nr:unnamed protein product [Auanema sp. JU1783]